MVTIKRLSNGFVIEETGGASAFVESVEEVGKWVAEVFLKEKWPERMSVPIGKK